MGEWLILEQEWMLVRKRRACEAETREASVDRSPTTRS